MDLSALEWTLISGAIVTLAAVVAFFLKYIFSKFNEMSDSIEKQAVRNAQLQSEIEKSYSRGPTWDQAELQYSKLKDAVLDKSVIEMKDLEIRILRGDLNAKH